MLFFMKKDISFDVDFNYALSENIIIRLTAYVQLTHSTPHYIISNFHFKDNPGGCSLLNDINIMATKDEKGINWVHTDSKKETMLSLAIGKAIEEKGLVEIAD
jgi:hypothetical protein